MIVWQMLFSRIVVGTENTSSSFAICVNCANSLLGLLKHDLGKMVDDQEKNKVTTKINRS